ncbi:MAG: HD domain-containing protein, partial [Sulfurimonas sp.]
SDDEKMILKLVTLFHDTGKGRKQDHSEVGAKIIAAFAKRLGMSEELIKRSVVLVKHHILMSNVAFKENIHNEKTLYKFMAKVGDTKNLDLLYILTYSDITGVGGDTYNSFNSKLLLDLYKNALEVSQNRQRITDAAKRLIIEKRLKKDTDFKALTKLQQKKILTIESNLFFFKHSVSEIIEIHKIAKEIKKYDFIIKNKNSLTIEIFRKIPINIGYLLSVLSTLNIANMEIFTLFDNVKYFRIDFIKNVTGNELVEVQEMIDASFDMSKEVLLRDVVIKSEEINIDCEHSLTHAQISVHTSNQKGLLSYIMYIFEQLNINVITAKIHSSKYKVKDSFLIEKQNNICDNGNKIYEMLTKGN